jgi:hypothetical protein
MDYDRLTISQTMQHTSKEVLGDLTNIFELIISGSFSSPVEFFRFDGEDVVTIAVSNGHVNVTSGHKSAVSQLWVKNYAICTNPLHPGN